MKLDNRLWVVVSAALSGLLLAGGWFLGVSPLLQSVSALESQTTTVEEQNAAIASQVASLRDKQEDLPELDAEYAELQSSVPNRVDGSGFITQVNAMANAAGIQLDGISLSAPAAYAPPVTAEPVVPAEGESESEDSESAEAAPAAPATPVGPAVVTDGMITAANFVTVGLTIQATGSNDAILDFIDRVQKGTRLVLITGVQKTAADQADGGEVVTLSLTGTMYVLTTGAATTTTTEG